ncbi:MAG TPA: hypothetical protein VFZ93_11915 [Albitalea sp.]
MTTVLAPASRRIGYPGLAAALASAAALGWRGREELDRPLAPLNAPAHWLWGDRALRQGDASLRDTGVGLSTHVLSSFFWAALYALMRARRRHPTALNAAADAAVTAGVAAVVDLAVVPQRLTPGFERQLSGRSLAWFYAAFAAGLAIGGIAATRAR